MNTTINTLSALTLAAAALAATAGSSSALTRGELLNANPNGFKSILQTGKPFHVPPYLGSNGHGITCLACNLPHPTPSQPPKDPGHGWGHGWEHGFGWDRWHYRFGRPEVIVEAQPVAIGGPVAAPARQEMAAAPQQETAAPCNCLTKQNLPDGSVLFEDICTKQSAIAPAMTVGSR